MMAEAPQPESGEMVLLTAWREGFPVTKRQMMVPKRMGVEIGRWYSASGWLVELAPSQPADDRPQDDSP
jgi:hypothetical protein